MQRARILCNFLQNKFGRGNCPSPTNMYRKCRGGALRRPQSLPPGRMRENHGGSKPPPYSETVASPHHCETSAQTGCGNPFHTFCACGAAGRRGRRPLRMGTANVGAATCRPPNYNPSAEADTFILHFALCILHLNAGEAFCALRRPLRICFQQNRRSMERKV